MILMSYSIRFLLFGILWLLLTTAAFGQRTVSDWVVIGTVGKWDLGNSNTRVKIGTKLNPGETVMRDQSSDRKTGSITLLGGGAPLTYACDNPATLPDHSNAGCVNPITIPDKKGNTSPEQDQGLLSFLVGVTQLLTEQPTRYYSAVSRDYGGLQDAVVQINENAVDLHPVLSTLNKGEYRLTFTKLEPESSSSAASASPAVLKWDPSSKPLAAGPEMHPGLYQLRVETIDGESVGTAWFLAVSAQEYAGKAQAFGQLTKATSSWGSNVPSVSIRAVNRAALDRLSK